jgi:protein-disulfide isomerase
MHNLFRVLVAFAIFASFADRVSAADSLSADQKKEVESIIQDYILKNPEIISKAIEVLQARQREAEERQARAALVAHRTQLFDDPTSPIGGNPNGDVTVIEFFDYRCGVCKRVHPIVDELVRTDKKIRRIYKEWPILGPDSILAARAALASRLQGKYFAFHDAMMEARSRLNQQSIMSIAKQVGLDTDKLARDMQHPDIERILGQNMALAQALRLNGTPSFVIEDTLLRGGRDLAGMRKLVADARAKK